MPSEDLLSTYESVRAKGSSRELAELEAKIFAYSRQVGEKLGDRRVFFRQRFGGNVSEYEVRSVVYRSGPWAFPLFERLDRGTKVTRVLTWLRVAKEEARANGTDPAEVLQHILSNGTKARRTKPRAVPVPPKPEPTHIASKSFRIGVEALAEGFMDAMFSNGTADEQKNQLVSDFKMSLGQLIDEFRERATRTKRDARADGLKRIGFERFRLACEVFGISTKFGQGLDIKRIGRLRVRRLRDLHPDRNPAEAARHEYDAVNSAFEILLAYSKQVKQTRGQKADDQGKE